jgi:RHS repeat-associated protein
MTFATIDPGATATTPLGYDAQYTSSDTGLQYLRNRVYDSGTAQFLSVDPLQKLTRAPYNHAQDNPLNYEDPTGLGDWLGLGIRLCVRIFRLQRARGTVRDSGVCTGRNVDRDECGPSN